MHRLNIFIVVAAFTLIVAGVLPTTVIAASLNRTDFSEGKAELFGEKHGFGCPTNPKERIIHES
jgi:hypothetical protein